MHFSIGIQHKMEQVLHIILVVHIQQMPMLHYMRNEKNYIQLRIMLMVAQERPHLLLKHKVDLKYFQQ